MKKFATWFILLLVSLFLPVVASASASPSPIQLFMNGKPLTADVPPQLVEGTTLVPVRTIAESLGSQVTWDGIKRLVTVNKGLTNIMLTIDNKDALVNDTPHSLEAAPVVVEGFTLLPLRFVSEQLGVEVTWDESTRSVFLYHSPEEEPDASEPGQELVLGESSEEENPGPGLADKPDVSGVCPVAPERAVKKAADGAAPADEAGTKPESMELDRATEQAEFRLPNAAGGRSAASEDEAGLILKDKPLETGLPATETEVNEARTVDAEADRQSDELTVVKGIVLSGDCFVVHTDGGNIFPNVLKLSDPDRIVIDLPQAKLSAELESQMQSQGIGLWNENNEYIASIRYSLFSNDPSTVRIVIDLNKSMPFKLIESNAPGFIAGIFGATYRNEVPLVVLDPGHGGGDNGATSVTGRKEKDLVLDIGLRVYELLKKESGLQVQMTRYDDTYLTLQQRAALANQRNADLFLSIHANSIEKNTTTVRGTESYYWTEQSEQFANVMHKRVLGATQFPDRKVKKGNFHVIRNTEMPAVLLEIGFLSHSAEEAAMFQESFKNRVAEAIAAGIKEQLNLN